MAKNKGKTYWPHMIVGFLALALTLSFWTVKTASSLPVQESNSYMMKYQQADIHINDVLESKAAFDAFYTITLEDKEMMVMTDNIHSKIPQPNVAKLSLGVNDFMYIVRSKGGEVVKDAKVTFLLTQPHSRREDQLVENVSYVDGVYKVQALDIQKEGRYVLQLKVELGAATGYSEVPAYLKVTR
jgi:hypothetical protein